MSTPQKKTPTKRITGTLPDGTRGPRKKSAKGKRKKSRKKGMLPQVVGVATLVAAVGSLMALGAYLATRAIPKDAPAQVATPSPLHRPKIQATLSNVPPKRPGLAVSMPDEVYFPKASDVAGTPVEPPVQGLLSRGVITVFADGKFRPNEPVTRAQFVSWCYNAVMAQSVAGPDPFVPAKKAFPSVEANGDEFGDVSADHWAASVLAAVKASGILGEMPSNYFRPDAPLTREEWLVLASDFGSKKEDREALKKPVDDQQLAVAYRALNYTDLQALKPGFKAYALFVFGDDKRKAWLGDTFNPPVNTGPWKPQANVTRGEAASWIGSEYEQIGKESF